MFTLLNLFTLFQLYPFPACRIIAFLKESLAQEYAYVCCMSALAKRSVMTYLGYMKIFEIRQLNYKGEKLKEKYILMLNVCVKEMCYRR